MKIIIVRLVIVGSIIAYHVICIMVLLYVDNVKLVTIQMELINVMLVIKRLIFAKYVVINILLVLDVRCVNLVTV